MNGLVLTNIGFEDVSASEVSSLISASDVKVGIGRVLFSFKNYQDLVDLCYKGRSFSKVVLLLSQFKCSGLPDKSILKDLPFIGRSGVVLCDRFGEHSFTSFEASNSLSKSLAEIYNIEVNRKNPDTIFYLLVDGVDCFFGVDFSGVDLGKRDYRIFLGADSLKGNVAASLLSVSGYDSKMALLDPFCRHGIIPIEAALFAVNASCHKFGKEKLAFSNLPDFKFSLNDEEGEFKGSVIAMDDNFKNVSSAKKNAKIAGVNKSVEFSRTDLKWLDAKFGKHFIDLIVSFPLQLNRLNENIFSKFYHQFFYQAEFILKKSGRICLVLKRGVDIVKQHAAEFKFILFHERKFKQGEDEFSLLVFDKQI